MDTKTSAEGRKVGRGSDQNLDGSSLAFRRASFWDDPGSRRDALSNGSLGSRPHGQGDARRIPFLCWLRSKFLRLRVTCWLIVCLFAMEVRTGMTALDRHDNEVLVMTSRLAQNSISGAETLVMTSPFASVFVLEFDTLQHFV
jgi:hypothetical protein